MRGWIGLLIAASGCRFDVAGTPVDPDGAPQPQIDAGTTPTVDAAVVVPPDAGGGDPAGLARANSIGPADVVLDGVVGEWGEGAWYAFTSPAAHLHTNESTYSPSLMVDFSVRWSTTTLYVVFVVHDDNVFVDSTTLWNDDSIEVYLDPDGAAGAYGPNDHWVVLAPDSMCRTYDLGSPVNIACRAELIDGGWIVEASVPFASLGVVPATGMTMGFGVGGNDDDDLPGNGANFDGYSGWYFPAASSTCAGCCATNPHQDPWCDTTRLGTLLLDF